MLDNLSEINRLRVWRHAHRFNRAGLVQTGAQSEKAKKD